VTTHRFVDLAGAGPSDAVVVIDVLRAFTFEPWLYASGVQQIYAVSEREQAAELKRSTLPDALLAGEHKGEKIPSFDLGNSPVEAMTAAVLGRTVVHRTSAGTQGLVRTIGSRVVFAASFVNATATAQALAAFQPDTVTYIVTGASLGRDGDEDLAAAELIAATFDARTPIDPAAYLARVPTSDAGQVFAEERYPWATRQDLALAMEHDRFAEALMARHVPELDAVAVDRHPL